MAPRNAVKLRWALAVLALGGVGLHAVSCVEILGLGYADSAAELCAMLDRCYAAKPLASCEARLGEGLADAAERDREDFLRFFAGADCTGTCTNARDCLDHPAICEPLNQACESVEECCAFTTGATVCEGGGCCKRVGVACEDDAECCGTVRCELNEEGSTSCAGQICGFEGDGCEVDAECCTNICLSNGTCGPLCQIDGVCSEDKQCCSQVCADGVCQNPPTCGEIGQGCATTPCCDESAVCYQGVCRDACFLDQEDCSNNAQCCSEFCDPKSFECGPITCLVEESACDLPGQPSVPCCPGLVCSPSHLCVSGEEPPPL